MRNAPIDKVDAFLLTLLVDTMSLSELLEIAPCDEAETSQRIQALAELGLVEALVEAVPQRAFASRYRFPLNVSEDAVTMRPPPAQATKAFDSEGVVTLRPPPSAKLELDLGDFADPPQTGIRARPLPPSQPLGKVRITQRKA